MKYDFLRIVAENAVRYKDEVVLADDAVKGLTFNRFYTLSGKVYAYLKERNIGKEDFVLICLPRGVQPIIALVGILRAGAAFVIVEDTYAPERIEYIRKDCGCKIVIDSKCWEEIQKCESQDGYEARDPHSAAYAVYTSGSTGNPKGVLHEYGNIDKILCSTHVAEGEEIVLPGDRFAHVAPLNFVASLIIVFHLLTMPAYNYIVPYAVVKNPMQLMMFIIQNRITGTFLTPSYIRKMTEKPPMLRFCVVGSEPANGIFLDGFVIHNIYTMSEAGFAVAHFRIDKKYEATPVGKSEAGDKIFLLDEEGKEVPFGEEGEICFENPYVRGYLNLPEQTTKAFVNGIYHTGDLGRFNEDGNLIICGRLNDMVKINGNRVEPGEIEEVAKKVLDLDWAAARIVDDGRKVFICVYYLEDREVDFEDTRAKMEQYLPYYMIPSFFIHIDQVPLKATGKMDRNALPVPDFASYQDDYIAPRDEIEEKLCAAYAHVLGIAKIGINDDFYQLGGDSIGAIEVLTTCDLEGLSSNDIFRGHTPEKVAALYRERAKDNAESPESRNDRALKEEHSLTVEQLYMFDYQLYTSYSTMYNLYNMLKIDKHVIDLPRFAKALQSAIANHPALLTVFSFGKDRNIVQRYRPELLPEIEVERITSEELLTLKDTLVQPFKMMNKLLFRARVFETEDCGYMFFDVHHTLFDGSSFAVFLKDIVNAYMEMPLEKDYYYMMLADREMAPMTDFYQESKAYFEKRYATQQWDTYPTIDHSSRENDYGEISCLLNDISQEELDKAEKYYKLSRNEFFVMVAGISVALYNGHNDVMISWIYNGREDVHLMKTVGLLFRDLPVGFRFTDEKKVQDLAVDVHEQISSGIEHSCYSYIDNIPDIIDGDVASVLYQSNMRDGSEIDALGIELVEVRQNHGASQTTLDMQILDGKDGLGLAFDYAASRYEESSMQKYQNLFIQVAKYLIDTAKHGNATFADIRRDVMDGEK